MGSISLEGSTIEIYGGVNGTWTYDNNSIDFTTYEAFLEEAGLYPSGTMLPDHSKITIEAAGSNGTNIMANGMYDFILAYYNPKSDGAVEGADLKARLPQWPASGLTLDGSANGGVTSRNIGGITADNAYRKGVDGASGEPNANYVGNITVPMANYLKSSAGISAFKNTNIVGDGDKWYAWDGSSGKNGNDLTLPATNVGLIGNYSMVYSLSTNGKGIFDFDGTAPLEISSLNSYLNLWSDVSRETIVGGFPVVRVRGMGIENILSGYGDMTGKVGGPT